MDKYYKNMILCSELDYHCILCKESFENLTEVDKHIRWEKHRHCIKQQSNATKYKEFVYKIGEIFYCVICNCVIKLEGLQEHIKSVVHKEHKENPKNVYKRTGLGIRDEPSSIKFPKLLINRLEWHGINNRKCLLCNETIENVNDHISSTKHMVYIIQSQIFESADLYFRKIEDDVVYCFRCCNIINNDCIKQHRCEEKFEKNKKDLNKNNEADGKYQSPRILKTIANIDKNIKDKTAKNNLSDAIDPTDQEDTIKFLEIEDHGKRRSELAKYGKENFIKLNEGGSKGYCSLCDIYISAHMKVATEHVNGLKHKGHLEIIGLQARKRHPVPSYKSVALQHFVKDMFHATLLQAICINYRICIDDLSFMFIITLDNNKQPKGKCFCCEEVFNWDDLNQHWKCRKHKNAFASAKVLMMDGEFVRVIRPGVFHCGICNKVFPFWDAMEKHIASWTHGIVKRRNDLSCTQALQWYIEQETKGTFKFSDDFYLLCKEALK